MNSCFSSIFKKKLAKKTARTIREVDQPTLQDLQKFNSNDVKSKRSKKTCLMRPPVFSAVKFVNSSQSILYSLVLFEKKNKREI